MTKIEMKFGFPLFTKNSSSVYLGNHKKLIISDIWAFWDYVIKKNGKNKEFLSALLEQSKYFYLAAETSPVKSKPLLFYYSFLNFAKIIINMDKGYGPSFIYHHGVKERNKGNFAHSEVEIEIQKNKLKNVSIELIDILDTNVPSAKTTIKVKDLLAHCVGVHRSYSEIYNQKECFYRLDDPELYKNGRELIFRAEVKCDDSALTELKGIGYSIKEEDEKLYYESKILTPRGNKTRKDYFTLSQQIRNEGIWYFIGNNGYTFYLSDHDKNRYAPETIIYNTMFYLGSITRYHPYMFDKIFSDKEQWLMSEFLTTQPKQFMYLATAKVLGQHVLKAYASF